MKNLFKALIFLSTCLPLLAAAPFEYAPVLTNLINMSIATNIPPGFLPANRVTAFLGGITTTNQRPYSGFYIFMADSVRATNSPTIGGTNVFRSIYWDTKTSQTATGRWEQVSWDIALADVITAGGPTGSGTSVPVITYDAKGRLTTVTTTPVTYPGSFSGFANPSATVGPSAVNGSATTAMRSDGAPALANTTVTLGSYGSATESGTFTVDAQGRLTAAANVTITGVAPGGAAGGDLGSTYPNPTVVKATALTSGRVTLTVGGIFADDADLTFLTDTLTATKVIAPTSVSTPSLISTTTLGITPAAGNNANVTTSGAGNFAVNTTGLVVTSAGNIGFGTASPVNSAGYASLSINGSSGGQIEFQTAGVGKQYIYSNGTDITFLNNNGYHVFSAGNVGIGTTSPLAKLSVNGGGHIGADSDPGDNNWTVDGLTTTGTFIVTTSSTHSYATVGTIAVFDGSKYLVSGIASAGLVPKYNTGDPNFLALTGDGDGQLYMNTTTGEKWHWYVAGPYWTP